KASTPRFSGVRDGGERAVEARCQACGGAGEIVERRLQSAAEIGADEGLEGCGRILPLARAKEAEPLGADCDVAFLVLVDDGKDLRALGIAQFQELVAHR